MTNGGGSQENLTSSDLKQTVSRFVRCTAVTPRNSQPTCQPFPARVLLITLCWYFELWSLVMYSLHPAFFRGEKTWKKPSHPWTFVLKHILKCWCPGLNHRETKVKLAERIRPTHRLPGPPPSRQGFYLGFFSIRPTLEKNLWKYPWIYPPHSNSQ